MIIREKLRFLEKLAELFDRREKKRFLLLLFVSLVTAVFQALGVASILPFISIVINPDIISESRLLSSFFDFFGFQSRQSFIIAAGLAMLSVIIIGNLLMALAIYMKTAFAWRKHHRLSSALLKKYLSMPYAYFLNQNTADLSKNVVDEVRNLTRSFMMPLLEIIIDFVVIIVILTALIIISPVATIAIILISAVFYAAVMKFGLRGKLKAKGQLRLEENEGRYKTAAEALGGIKDIKVLGRENYFSGRFSRHSSKFSYLQAWNLIVGQLPRYFIEIIAFGGVVVLVLYLLVSGRDIQQAISMVSLFAFAGYRVLPAMNRMFHSFTILQFNRAVLDRIHEDLTCRGEVRAPRQAKPLKFEESIVFKNLSFAYSGSNSFVLKDINISIEKGRSVALAGPTGTGKTTFVDIFLGLLSPSEGEILVDGVKISGDNLRSWQGNIGYVPQHIYLSDDTVKRNIAFGLPDEFIEMEKVERAADISNLHDFIVNELPRGYNTVVGERGIRLSGGQRQRVGIARALYGDPEVLVLDEATSSLDGVTEESVLKAIEWISELKTLIIIAHRLTTVRKCDVIYLLDRGRIAASGSYDELVETSAQFRAMGGV